MPPRARLSCSLPSHSDQRNANVAPDCKMPAIPAKLDCNQLLPPRLLCSLDPRKETALALPFRPESSNGAEPSGDVAVCPIVSLCGFFRPLAEAAPGINRAAHAVP